MNPTWNQETRQTQWMHLLFWLALLAGACVTTAWGESYHYDRGDRYDRHDRDDRRARVDSRTRDNEVDFIQRMIDFEVAGTRLARVSADKTRHGDMRDYLSNLERQCNRRIDRLQSMMQTWYGQRYEPRVDPKYQQRVEMFQNPDMSGTEFEIRLLKTLIDLNQEESQMAERYLPRLSHSDLQGMANTVVNRRSDVANQLQDWLKRWYDISYTSDADLNRGGSPQYYRNR